MFVANASIKAKTEKFAAPDEGLAPPAVEESPKANAQAVTEMTEPEEDMSAAASPASKLNEALARYAKTGGKSGRGCG